MATAEQVWVPISIVLFEQTNRTSAILLIDLEYFIGYFVYFDCNEFRR